MIGTFSEKSLSQKQRKCVGFKGSGFVRGTLKRQQKRSCGRPQLLDFERFSLKKTVDAVLTLRELEAPARLGAAIFLTFDCAAIAGQEASGLHHTTKGGLLLGQGLANAVLDGPGLARKTTALNGAITSY